MLRSFLIPAILLFVFASCENKNGHWEKFSLKDSLLKGHLQLLDSITYFDTTDINFKLLKAYQNNDTNYLKQVHSNLKLRWANKKQWDLQDSCVHVPKLQDLNAYEAYRFEFTPAFCRYKLNITVTNNADSANIHFILYKPSWDTVYCQVISEYDRPMSNKDWNDFNEAMRKADFWGLKRNNDALVLDGSTLITTGCINAGISFNQAARYNYVYRYGHTTLDEPFNLILKLSGYKQDCY